MRHLLLTGLCVVVVGAARGAEGDPALKELLAKVIETRRARMADIRSISYSVRSENTASAAIIAARAKSGNIPVDRVKNGLVQAHDYRYLETSDGLFRFESLNADPDGKGTYKSLLTRDGKRTWKLRTRTLDDGFEITDVEVSGDLAEEHPEVAMVRKLLDGPMRGPGARTLVEQVIEGSGATALRVEPIDGDPCLVVAREEVVNKAATRYSVWLDTTRQFTLRRAKVEVLYPVNDHWFTFNLWTIQKLDMKKITESGKPDVEYWYPAQATLQMSNYRDEETFGETLSITDLQINVPTNAALFTPVIPQGSNVRDARTGIVSVHGNGPSPQLKRIIKNRTGQARETLRTMESRGDPGIQEPPTSWATYGSWLTLVCGVVGLITALMLRLGADRAVRWRR